MLSYLGVTLDPVRPQTQTAYKQSSEPVTALKHETKTSNGKRQVSMTDKLSKL